MLDQQAAILKPFTQEPDVCCGVLRVTLSGKVKAQIAAQVSRLADILEQFVKYSEISQGDCTARVVWIGRDEPNVSGHIDKVVLINRDSASLEVGSSSFDCRLDANVRN